MIKNDSDNFKGLDLREDVLPNVDEMDQMNIICDFITQKHIHQK